MSAKSKKPKKEPRERQIYRETYYEYQDIRVYFRILEEGL